MKDRRRGFVLTLAVALSALAASAPVKALEGDARGGEVGVLAGILGADSDLAGESGSLEPTVGLRGGSVFLPRWIWFVDALYAKVGTNSALGDVTTYTGRTGLEWLFVNKPGSAWFINGAFGWTSIDYANGGPEDFHRPLVSAGIGQRFRVGGRKQIRWELRGDVTIDDPGLGGADMTQVIGVAGFIWGPPQRGGLSYGDRDGDQVRDAKDDCPDTPAGATVDRNGCPLDSDGDGVPDGVDRCAGSPLGEVVNDLGCPSDQDGDGVGDGTDACPGTQAGLSVDDWGCPRDRDRDGVPDDLDRCRRTPWLAEVDEQGCAIDDDGDGVPNGSDQCIDTPPASNVDSSGCPLAAFIWNAETETLLLWLDFAANGVELDDRALGVLDEVLPLLTADDFRFEVGGHIDPAVGESDLDRLSARRATVVRDYLVSRGIDPDRLETRGYGSEVPLAGAIGARRSLRSRIELKRIGE